MKKPSIIAMSLLLLIACTTQYIPLDMPFYLSYGEIANIKETGVSLTLKDVKDSRCPKNVECLVAGEVVVTLNVAHGKSPFSPKEEVTVTLPGGSPEPATSNYKGLDITLSKVLPLPVTTKNSDLTRIELKVSRHILEDQILAGTQWILASYNEAGETPIEVTNPEAVTFNFAENGTRVSGNLYCNTWLGQYKTENGTLAISEVLSTLAACETGDEEAFVREVFSDMTRYAIDENNLLLITKSGRELHLIALGSDDVSTELAVNMVRWEKSAISHYKFTYEEICNCLPADSTVIEVLDGEIISATSSVSGEPLEDEKVKRLNTIDGLFNILKEAIKAEAASIDASYDETLGHPVKVNIDYDEQIGDEERIFSVTDFMSLDEETPIDDEEPPVNEEETPSEEDGTAL